MEYDTNGRNRFYTCGVCYGTVRPWSMKEADAPDTLGYGSERLLLCSSHYKRWLREHRDEVRAKNEPTRDGRPAPRGLKSAAWRRADEARGPLTPEEYRVARIAAGRVPVREDLVQVLGILGLIDTTKEAQGA